MKSTERSRAKGYHLLSTAQCSPKRANGQPNIGELEQNDHEELDMKGVHERGINTP